MDLWFGADVIPTDGGVAGELTRVVCDPASQEVGWLVVAHSGLGELSDVELLVPMRSVADASPEELEISMTQAEFDELERFETERNIAPPPVRGHSADLDEDFIEVPDVPPVGAATGIESIAFTPIIEEAVHVPAWDRIIDRSSTVFATDGEVGELSGVGTDEQRRLATLLVKRGEIFGEIAAVPAAWVSDYQAETIQLQVSTKEVESVSSSEQ